VSGLRWKDSIEGFVFRLEPGGEGERFRMLIYRLEGEVGS
jgi:hypothetical protein